jgi:hypothetical protein
MITHPNGLWGGYSQYWSPSVSSHIGCDLVGLLVKAARCDDQAKAISMVTDAIVMLNAVHKKHLQDDTTIKIKCHPTEQAGRLVDVLGRLHHHMTHHWGEVEKP